MSDPRAYVKAILAGAIAFAGAGATAATDGSISAAEWWGIASTTLVALGVVYGVPNGKPEEYVGEHRAD